MLGPTRWLQQEIPPISEQWRPLATLYMAGFAIVYAVSFLASLHFVFLGPGLGDDFTFQHLLDLLQQSLALSSGTGTLVWFVGFVALVTLNVTVRAVVVFRGYHEYRTEQGSPLPIRDLITYTLLNVLNLLFVPVLLVVSAGVAMMFGWSPEAGWGLLSTLVNTANAWVERIPTLFQLPSWLAFFVTLMVWSFLHYWLHRFSHTRRALWLLLHRPHHMTEHLCYGTVMPVFMSFPLGLLLVVPYVFLFGATAKLFSATPLFAEMILFQLIVLLGEIYGHSPALYERAIRSPWIRGLSFFYCQGVYHILHHSAVNETQRVTSNNTVNIGAGLFCCWDKLFGTFTPLTEKVPPLGLHGRPRLQMNPLRLLCSGGLQLIYELYHNRGVVQWWTILTGPTTYTPAVSRDYSVHSMESIA